MKPYTFFLSPKPNKAGLIVRGGNYLMYIRNDLDMVVRNSHCHDFESADKKLKEFVFDFEMRQEYAMGGDNDELFNISIDRTGNEERMNHTLDGYVREDF